MKSRKKLVIKNLVLSAKNKPKRKEAIHTQEFVSVQNKLRKVIEGLKKVDESIRADKSYYELLINTINEHERSRVSNACHFSNSIYKMTETLQKLIDSISGRKS